MCAGSLDRFRQRGTREKRKKKNHGSKSRFVPPISGERKRGNKREREREREGTREREREGTRESIKGHWNVFVLTPITMEL